VGSYSLFAATNSAAVQPTGDDGRNLLVTGVATLIVLLVALLAVRYMRGWNKK
jgi:hypothetical protein